MFAVSFKEHTKLIQNPTEENVREKFGIIEPNIFIQSYNHEFDCFIDVEWSKISDLESKKLRILIEPQPEVKIPNLTESADTVEQKKESHEMTPIPSTSASPIPSTSTSPIPSTSGSLIPPTSSKVAGKLSQYFYELPKIPPNSRLGKYLKNQQTLNKTLKGNLLDLIYEDLKEKNISYIGHKYALIADSILRSYPYLKSGLPYDSAQHLWAKSLRTKWANEKVRATRNLTPKKKKTEHRSTNQSEMYDIPNYKPVSSKDDDDPLSVESHQLWLSKEHGKTVQTRNTSSITKRMDATFKSRRWMLFVEQPPNAMEILDAYPCLGIEKEAINETRRLFGHNFFNDVSENMEDFAHNLWKHGCSSRNKHLQFLEDLFSTNTQNHKETLLFKLVGYASILAGEDPKDFIGTLDDVARPYLKKNEGTVSLLVDNCSFISDVSPVAAAFLWRGRDHGLPPYNDWRERYGLPRVRTLSDLQRVMPAEVANAFSRLYKSIDDIDLFPALIAEFPASDDGLFGPLLTLMLAERFKILKYGDRFFYESYDQNPYRFTINQLDDIRDTSLASLICAYTNTRVIQPFVMHLPNRGNNRVMDCLDILQNTVPDRILLDF